MEGCVPANRIDQFKAQLKEFQFTPLKRLSFVRHGRNTEQQTIRTESKLVGAQKLRKSFHNLITFLYFPYNAKSFEVLQASTGDNTLLGIHFTAHLTHYLYYLFDSVIYYCFFLFSPSLSMEIPSWYVDVDFPPGMHGDGHDVQVHVCQSILLTAKNLVLLLLLIRLPLSRCFLLGCPLYTMMVCCQTNTTKLALICSVFFLRKLGVFRILLM